MTESNSDKPVILVVDDSKVIRVAARKMLGSDYETIEAGSGVEGWAHIQKNDSISVVFTDMQMPEMDGLELLAHIRDSDNERIAALPVIIITGHEDSEAAKKKVFDLGATDFISKPFESIDLISRAKSYAKLNRQVAELEKQSAHDPLTGLFNAASFVEQGDKTCSFARRHKTEMSVAVLEISNFQKIFLNAGKTVAQQIVVAVSKRLTATLRTEDVAARTGVARISLILASANIKDTRDVVARMVDAISKLSFDSGKGKMRIELACGISALNQTAQSTFAEVQQQAESALAEALKSVNEKIILFAAAQAEAEIATETEAVTDMEVSEEEMQQAFRHIMRGTHAQIPVAHLPAVVERLQVFMQYIESKK